MCVGIDICKSSRFENCSEKLLKRLFTDDELTYIRLRKLNSDTISGMFSAKEAFFKALGTGIRNLGFKDVSVKKNALGKPFFAFSDRALSLLSSMGVERCDVSITHDGGLAVSCVNLHKNDKIIAFENAISHAEVDEKNIMSTKMIKQLIPQRPRVSHKGTYGKCFVLAGSKGLTGAAFFSAQSCIKCGSGLVTLGCAQSLNSVFEVLLKEVMTFPLDDSNGVISYSSIEKVLKKCESSDVLLAGCGLSLCDDIKRIMYDIVDKVKIPIVIDADGINAVSANIDVLKKHKQHIVITPHFMEFSRLSGLSIEKISENPKKCALEFAKEYNVTVILKSENTLVVAPDGRCFKNTLGNPGMATGGTGDVLAGAVASFIGQGLSVFDASLLAVFIHSLAGDMAAFDKGFYGLTPSDILDNIPYALKYLGG